MAKPRYITQEIKAAILKDNESLSGCMHSRARQLKVKYKYSLITICNVIRHTVKVKKPLTEEDKQQIRVLYSMESGTVKHHKHKAVAEKVGVSHNTIRLVMNEKEKPEVYFNPRMQMF